MDSYIFVHLMGGLGNQLFQYAAGLLHQNVNGGKLFLEKATNSHDKTDYRNIIFTKGEKYDKQLPIHISLYQENGFVSWNPENYKVPILLLYGYFQNYPSLAPILPSFRIHILDMLKDKRSTMKQKYNVKENSGFIHVRRGDYLQVSSVVTTIDYYKKAMLNVKNNISKWYIFSDDIAWCKQQDTFRNLNPVYVDEKDPVLTLALMCEINGSAIIANSTFSWMGAYLALGANESVIYPLRWIHPGNPDLFPSEWIGI